MQDKARVTPSSKTLLRNVMDVLRRPILCYVRDTVFQGGIAYAKAKGVRKAKGVHKAKGVYKSQRCIQKPIVGPPRASGGLLRARGASRRKQRNGQAGGFGGHFGPRVSDRPRKNALP